MKLTVLGGSSIATPVLIDTLIKSDMPLQEITLFGRSQERLDRVVGVARQLAGQRLSVIGTTSLKEALVGTEMILNQIRVGGLKAREFDEMIPTRYGLLGEETLGVGGFFNAARSIAQVLDYAAAAQEWAPHAWWINLTNPAGLVAAAIQSATRLSVVSVCDLPQTLIAKVQRIFGEDVRWDWLGLNHLGWLTRLENSQGQSLMEEAQRALGDELGFPDFLLKSLQVLPSPYLRYAYFPHRYLKGVPERTRATELMEIEAQLMGQMEDQAPGVVGRIAASRNPHWYAEVVVPVMRALTQELPSRLVLQVPRPHSPTYERAVWVSRQGIAEAGPLPSLAPDLQALLNIHGAYEVLALQAILTRSQELAVRALAANPWVGDWDIAERLVSDTWPELF